MQLSSSLLLKAMACSAVMCSPLLAQDRPAGDPDGSRPKYPDKNRGVPDSTRPGERAPDGTTTTTDRRMHDDRDDRTDFDGRMDLRTYDWLKGRDVRNDSNEKVADVSDFIVNRGSGHIEHVVLATGKILGMGGSTVVVPFDSLRWTGDKDGYLVMAVSKDDLKNYPTYSKEDWAGLVNPDQARRDRNRGLYDLGTSTPAERDVRTRESSSGEAWWSSPSYTTADLQRAKTSTIEGSITDVERVWVPEGQFVLITVKDAAGNERRQVLTGPSWYMSGADLALSRGETVKIEAYDLGNGRTVARSISRDNDRLSFRNAQGEPEWANDRFALGSSSYSPSYYRYVLMSTLDGLKISCQGKECGKVDDVLIDRRGGNIAFLSIDPNQNFLGIGDVKRLVPWGVASVSVDNKTVRIDATKEMILASPAIPTDIASLNDRDSSGRIYKTYGIAAPTRSPRMVHDNDAHEKFPGWGRNGMVLRSLDRSATKTITGTIKELKEVRLGNDTASACAAEIKTADGTHTILLGPHSFVKSDKRMCPEGSEATINACRAMIDGKEYWVAERVQCGSGNTVVLVNPSSNPAWDDM